MAKYGNRPLPQPPGQNPPRVVTGMPRSGRRPSVDIYMGDEQKPAVPFVYKPYKPEEQRRDSLKTPQFKPEGRRGPLPALPAEDGPPVHKAPSLPPGVRTGRRPSLPTLPMPRQPDNASSIRDSFPPRGIKQPLSPIPDHDQTDGTARKGRGLKQDVPPPRPHLKHTSSTGHIHTGYLSPRSQQGNDQGFPSQRDQHRSTYSHSMSTPNRSNPDSPRRSAEEKVDTGYLSPRSQQGNDKGFPSQRDQHRSAYSHSMSTPNRSNPDSPRRSAEENVSGRPVTPPPDYPMNDNGPMRRNRRPSVEDLGDDLREALSQRAKALNKPFSTPSTHNSENTPRKIPDRSPDTLSQGQYNSAELTNGSNQTNRGNQGVGSSRTQNPFALNTEDYLRMDKLQNQKRISPQAIHEPDDEDNYVPVSAYTGPPIVSGQRGSQSVRSRRDSILPPGLEPEPEAPDVQPYRRPPCPFMPETNERSPPRSSNSIHAPPTGIYTTYGPPCDYDKEFEQRFTFNISEYWPEVPPKEIDVKIYPSEAATHNRLTEMYT